MRLKKLLAGALSGLLLLPTLAMPFASAEGEGAKKDPMDNLVLETIYDRKEGSRLTNDQGLVTYGSMWTKDLKIDVSEIPNENLALSLKLKVESVDGSDENPLSVLQAPFGQFELADNMQGGTYLTWQVKEINKQADGSPLVAGEWNDILLPFSTGKRDANFDPAKITFFRFELAHLPKETGVHSIRLSDVSIVDTSKPAVPDEEDPDWDTTYEVADIPFTMDSTIAGKGSATPTTAVAKSFDAVDASKHNPKKLQLQMDIEVENVTNPGDISVLTQIKGQVELTSTGGPDKEESAWGVGSLDWRDGKATYKLMLSSTSPSGGELNLANINFMRIYMNEWPATFTDTLKIKVSNVKLVDVTNTVSLPTIFGDGMLFQQNKPINIWGYHKAGTEVAVKFYKGKTLLDTKTATAGEDGKWSVEFAAQKGSYDTYCFEVLEGDKIVQTVEDILIGELWLSSGQSNMALTVGTDMDSAAMIAGADNPNLRFFLEPTFPSGQNGEQPIDPAKDIPGATWGRGDNGVAVSKMSSVSYTFAKNLQEELDVPVGVLNTSVGGSVIEAWLPRDAVEADATVKAELKKRSLYYDPEWWPTSAGSMSTLYNQKVGPLEGLGIAGVIWYQGESNSNRSEIYDIELDLMKKSWSEKFGFENNEMPLIFTQVAPYRYDNGATNKQHLGYLAEFMASGFRMNEDKNMAMLTIYDLPLDHMKDGSSSDPIHPRIKTPVGERFFRSAMNLVYGGEGEYTAPLYKSMEIKDNAVYVTFDHVGDGLASIAGNTLHGFTIAGEDGIYVNAEAEIVDKDTVKVWSNRVADPKNVIYAFDNFNQAANLINSAEIPASPFRTVEADDTTLKPSPNITYFTAQDWMLADGDVWVYDSTNTENRNTGYRPSWKAEGAVYSYSTAIKAEGASSLKLSYDKGGDIKVSPVLSYDSLQFKLGNYKYLTVKVLNPDARDKALGLSITSGDKTYSAAIAGGDAVTKTIAGGNKFVTVTFDLTKLTAGEETAADAAAILNAATAVNFTFSDTAAGVLFLDAVSVGMTEAVVDEAELDAKAPVAGATKEQLEELLKLDESLYTEESVKAEAYQAAKKAAEDVLKDDNANFLQISEAYEALEAAQKALVLKPTVDKTELEKALKLDESLYTEESVKAEAYQTAKKAAEDVLKDESATKEQVDKALADLLEAQKTLVKKAESKLGDINNDGKVDTTDARLALQHAVGKITLKADQLTAGDVNADSKVDTTDARLILQYAVGKIDSFPAAEK